MTTLDSLETSATILASEHYRRVPQHIKDRIYNATIACFCNPHNTSITIRITVSTRVGYAFFDKDIAMMHGNNPAALHKLVDSATESLIERVVRSLDQNPFVTWALEVRREAGLED